jgi:hypothetical protein
MFGQPKPLASLSSGLLARKGQARPAMRPQGFASMIPGGAPALLDDLGWNDMGSAAEPVAEPVLAPVIDGPAEPAPVPPVLVAREALKEEIEAPVARRPDPVVATPPVAAISLATAARIGRDSARQTKKGGKAAFTLRLDADRHLRLRLASAVSNRSAQLLVAEALDQFLATMPEVEALIAQLPRPKEKAAS